MTLLRTIETRIARLVEGTFGKVFRTSVQPVELARRLVKEMDEHQQRTVRNIYVPNHFDVYLSRDDHRQLSQYAAALCSELAEYLAEHARRNGYALLTRPKVQLQLDRDLALGQFGIAVRMQQPDEAAAAVEAHAEATPAGLPTQVQPAVSAPAAPPAATLALLTPSGPIPLSNGRMRIGRGSSNDVVLNDQSVSREHAELVPTADGWKVRDLGSTNGLHVNGETVQERAVAAGDEISFGSCSVRVGHWPPEEA